MDNKNNHLERPTARNIVFDSLRIQFAAIFYPFFFGGVQAFTGNGYEHTLSLVSDFLVIAFMSALVNRFVSKQWFKLNKLTWAVISLEYVASFGLGAPDILNRTENENGSLWMLAFFTVFDTHL
eukprot:CAMPEP_0168623680 /NCGR_PEP_ID=MMETSP0449_2-20121227/8962_1 /TAXON_ID=1082188 /ORGANISM="Strombidium rassoulzadegani, Strain ras09" /LENGTH=123 /DNA_ID=CAMNT_0008665093 /DNA_START=224 /DNA_END=595 /DNA_ORIENTATION=-